MLNITNKLYDKKQLELVRKTDNGEAYDESPTENSKKAVQSGAVYAAIEGIKTYTDDVIKAALSKPY